jgi:hypothetical protein
LNGGSDEGFINLRVVKIGIRLPGGSLGGGRPGGTRRSLREWDEGLNGGSDEAFIDLRVVKVGIRLPGTGWQCATLEVAVPARKDLEPRGLSGRKVPWAFLQVLLNEPEDIGAGEKRTVATRRSDLGGRV